MKAANWVLVFTLGFMALVAPGVAKADTLSVVTSSVSNGEILGPDTLPTVLTEIVQFSAPVDVFSVSFTLLDPNSNSVSPLSFSFDATGLILTINWQLDLSGTYLLVIPTTVKNFSDTANLNAPFDLIFSINHTSPVPVLPAPEPSLLLLAGAGLLPVILRRKRS
jgi:hypothetical protein